MADVYGAFDEVAQRRVALKRLKPEKRGDAAIHELFQREFYTLGQLAHPRIVAAYDYGLAEGVAYYTMELLDGTDLRSLAPLEWRRACELLRDIASGLCVLHSRRLIHRDLSARNVRCTADGRAKLIDFGAMVPFGRSSTLVGTAPFVAPEVLYRQALDGRCDLYSLGALAYWLIAGRHAYEVDRLTDLREAWQVAPLPLRMLVPEVPPALNDLVMLLLCLDRMARPFNTADAIGKLAAVANLPPDDGLEVRRAFLATPALVGREAERSRFADRLGRALHDGGPPCWLVRGAHGVGRTRLLDELRIEAKLNGATAVALSAAHVSREYGAAVELVRQLLEAHPEARQLAPADVGWLAACGFQPPEAPPPASRPASVRQRLHRALLEWLLELARSHTVVITVDDLQGLDAPSAALIAALAASGGSRCAVVASLPDTGDAFPSAGAPAALQLFRQQAEEVVLEPLSREATLALLGSVFGEVPDLTLLAARLYEASGGYPRAVMELAEELVDTEVVHYEAGHWRLPVRLEGVTGRGARTVMLDRLATLSSEARTLALALSFSPDTAFGSADCLTLIGGDAREPAFDAVDQLTRARIVTQQDAHVRLAHTEWAPLVLQAQGHVADAMQVHGRLAVVFETRGQLARAAMHWTAAVEPERSAACVERHALQRFEASASIGAAGDAPPEDPELYRDALEAALASPERTPRQRLLMQLLLVEQGWRAAPDLLKPELPSLFSRLALDCGLHDLRELTGPDRLARALAMAQERFDATPPAERGLAPAQALRVLVQASLATASTATAWWDHDLLELLPRLDPLLPLSPAVRVAHQVISAYEWLASGAHPANASFQAVLERLDQADGTALAPEARARARELAVLALGIVEAAAGLPGALLRAEELDRHPSTQVLACRIRVFHNINQGDLEQAAHWQREAEGLHILHAPAQLKEGSELMGHLLVHAFADDLQALKRCVAEVRPLAERLPGWEPVRLFGEGACASIQGDHAAALCSYRAALQRTTAGKHPIWNVAAEQELWTLVELGREVEAITLGRERLAQCERQGLPRWLAKPIAVAHARLGEHEQACALADAEIAGWEAWGSTGLHMGRAYEARARVAIYAGDRAAFDKYAALCAKHYNRGGSPAFAAKHQRLLDEARAQELTISQPLIRAAQLSIALERGGDVTEAVLVNLREAAPAERARHALKLITERTASETGHLFLCSSQGPYLAASATADTPSEALRSAVLALVANAGEQSVQQQAQEQPDSAEATRSSIFLEVSSPIGGYRTFPLWFERSGTRVVVGVVALRQTVQAPTPPDQRFFEGVALAFREQREAGTEDGARSVAPGDARSVAPAPVGSEHAKRVAGRYRLQQLLGRGGLGSVYRARDEVTGETVALKRLRCEYAEVEAEARTLFEREYHTLKQLAHPSLIAVHDYGLDDQAAPYYTMELLSGQDLRDLAPLPWREVCGLLLPVASSLAVLHSRRLLHRDVSARNVRRTADGRAKLLDFGAMTAMGVAEEAMGTPPYLAPEAVHGQPLDARTDLYSLGALFYLMLTGRHAYPSRSVGELRDRWRSPVPSPHHRNPEIPEALGKLVMALLALDANARPVTAAEVMAKLSAIADLPLQEEAAVHRAYLTTPKLVARDAVLLRVRKLLVRARRGRGGSLYVEAEAGLGRSRLLDACLLEAKLAGANAARVGASDAGGEYVALHSLLAQLMAGFPQLAPPPDIGPAARRLPRAELHEALRAWLVAACRERPCVILVDDYHRIDEPSAAMLAALADRADSCGLVMIASAQAGADHAAPIAWEVLVRRAGALPLSVLSLGDTEVLLSSIFGDVPHVRLLSARLHVACGGNPRNLLELAQQLVDIGTVKYEAGRWVLPDRLEEITPARASSDLAHRLAAVSDQARALAGVMALAPDLAFSHEECRLLCEGEGADLFAVMDELAQARVLVRQGTRQRLAYSDDVRDRVVGADERMAAAHLRLAGVLQSRGAVSRAAVHFMRGGETRKAVACLLELSGESSVGRGRALSGAELQFRATESYRGTLAAAVDAAQSARESFMLRMLIVELGVHAGPALIKAHVPALLQRLTRDCGLDDYHTLDGEDRLTRALASAQARFDVTPEQDRVASPADAVSLLARVVVNTAQSAVRWYDHGMIDLLPSLEPLVPLSPVLAVAQQMSTAFGHLVAGRLEHVTDSFGRVLKRLGERDRAGLDIQAHVVAQLGASTGLGLRLASLGELGALDVAAQMDENPHGQVLACHVRVVYYLTVGDGKRAEEWQRRAELLEIQHAPTELTTRRHVYSQLAASAYAEDLVGVKETLAAIAAIAEFAPGWEPLSLLARASYEHIRGDHESALICYRRALSLALPGRHLVWPVIKERQLWLLVEMGRLQEAIDSGTEALEAAEREHLPRWLVKPLAVAYAKLGDHEHARKLAQEEVAAWKACQSRGLHLGRAYETAARVEIYAGDRKAFERYAAHCAEEFLAGDIPALHAKYQRLLDEARQHGFAPAIQVPSGGPAKPEDDAHARIKALLEACPSPAGRTSKCLDLLLDAVGVPEGCLFGVTADGLRVLSSTREPSPAMRAFARDYLDAEIEESQALTLSLDGGRSDAFADARGTRYQPILMRTEGKNDERVVGVALLAVSENGTLPPAELVATIAEALLDIGDVASLRAAV